jgi:hypothetical protein
MLGIMMKSITLKNADGTVEIVKNSMQIIPTALCPVQLGLAINIVRVQSITLKNADGTVEIAYDSIDCPVKKQ